MDQASTLGFPGFVEYHVWREKTLKNMWSSEDEARDVWLPGGNLKALLVEPDIDLKIARQVDFDPERRHATFIISTEDVDRMDDTVALAGWDLSNYNGIVLWNHVPWELPVGNSEDTTHIDEDMEALISTCFFPDEGAVPMADMVHDLTVMRIVVSASVGFMPKLWQFDEERMGINFLEQELLEWSLVNVPALPQAQLLEARSVGINLEPLVNYAIEQLDFLAGEEGVWVPRKQLEGIVRMMHPERTISIPKGLQGHKNLVDMIAERVGDGQPLKSYLPIGDVAASTSPGGTARKETTPVVRNPGSHPHYQLPANGVKPVNTGGLNMQKGDAEAVVDAITTLNNNISGGFGQLRNMLQAAVPGAVDPNEPLTVGKAQEMINQSVGSTIAKALEDAGLAGKNKGQGGGGDDDDTVMVNGVRMRNWTFQMPAEDDQATVMGKIARAATANGTPR